jgi:calcineurin-like phosphoesterase family protein
VTVHFTADLHLDHENVLSMSGRLFRNIVEHNDVMIDQINRYVAENDRLYVLGDVAWTSIDNYLARINCKDVHLIWGNHDKQNFGKHFKSHQDVLEIKIGKKPNTNKVFLSHYAHAYWPSSHYGAFHLYGHTHRQREDTLDACFPGRRSLDVGVDNARFLLGEYRPFSEHDIVDILGHQPGHDPVQFYTDFQDKLPKFRAAQFGTRKPGVPSRDEMYDILKARSEELKNGGS